jgi:hypothetical protein
VNIYMKAVKKLHFNKLRSEKTLGSLVSFCACADKHAAKSKASKAVPVIGCGWTTGL